MIDPYIGMIKLYPYNFIPMGWAKCDGATLPINQYNALYSLLGIRFGGDGHSNFKLPDLTNALPFSNNVAPNNYVYCIALSGLYPSRS